MLLRDKIFYFQYILLKQWDFWFCDKWRAWVVKKLLRAPLEKLYVRYYVTIHDFKKLKLGKHVSINQGCFLSCQGGLSIGDYVSIGHNTSIITTEHTFNDSEKPIKYQPILQKPVSIGNNVWISANVTILAGVSIADGTVIAAGAVVNKDVLEMNSIIGGVPAKHIKYRGNGGN